MAGTSLGGIFFGTLSDRFGRRPTIVLCLLLHVALSTGASFASDYASFIVLRALDGAAAHGAYYTSFVLAIEVVGPSKRNGVGMAIVLGYVHGYFMLCLLAYFLRTWRKLQLAQGLIMIPFVCYWWVLPESPRWLISNKRVKSARDALQRAARVNGVTIPDDVYTSLLTKSAESKEETTKFTMIDLLRTPRMRKITLLMCFAWMAVAGVYYGLILGMTDLAGDPYVNFALGAALELGLAAVGWAAMERWGRKPVTVGSALLAGIGCLASAGTTGHPTVSRNFALLGRVLIGVNFICFSAYSPDMFPTVVRGMGMGAVTAFSRVGTILAPFVTLLGDVWLPLPMLTFGVVSCAGGLAVYLVPETLGLPLPETIEDVENSGRQPQRKDNDKSESYTNPWPKRDPFRHVKRVVVCYQIARDGDYFSSILVP
ncbi:SLC22A3 [Branchiostoma lanceolatum]|nr:SLC22A3 [Branchiostoma lanceolatum]